MPHDHYTESMENLAEDQLAFTLHPPQDVENLDAFVFSQKLSQLLSALAAADKAVNTKRANTYQIFKLKSSAPIIILNERTIGAQSNFIYQRNSAISAFGRCATGIVEGDVVVAQAYGDCARRIAKLSSGDAKGKFSYGEVWSQGGNVIRIDSFLCRRAKEALRGEQALHAGFEIEPLKWFRGIIEGTFDGVLKAIDLRGAVPECALVVGPESQIDCIFREGDLPTIGKALTARARVRLTGRAIYDGRSGLPGRLEIRGIELIDSDVDFLKWRNAFEPFPIEDWEDDNS